MIALDNLLICEKLVYMTAGLQRCDNNFHAPILVALDSVRAHRKYLLRNLRIIYCQKKFFLLFCLISHKTNKLLTINLILIHHVVSDDSPLSAYKKCLRSHKRQQIMRCCGFFLCMNMTRAPSTEKCNTYPQKWKCYKLLDSFDLFSSYYSFAFSKYLVGRYEVLE